MNPPNLWWSATLAREFGDEPLAGLIHGDTYGLFVFYPQAWARLADLPPDAVELLPLNHLHEVEPVEDPRDWAGNPHPRPWRLNGQGQGIGISDANGDRVGWMSPRSLAAATVRAVNRYGTRAIGVQVGERK